MFATRRLTLLNRMLATIRDSNNLEILTGQLSQFLAWHRLRNTEGLSKPLMALWVGPVQDPPGQPPPGLPPVTESVGLSGSWMVHLFEDEELSRRELMVALSADGSAEEPSVSHPSAESAGRVVPVLPHDLKPRELLKVMHDIVEAGGRSSSEYVLQHSDTGRLLSSRECCYHIRPLL